MNRQEALLHFATTIQVSCPVDHAEAGELCDLPGVWVCVDRLKAGGASLFVAEKTRAVMRSTPVPIKEQNIMPENQNETVPNISSIDTEEVQPTRLQKFVNKHPRAAKVAASITAGVAVVSVGLVANTMQKNRKHLHAAAEDAKDALRELSTSVSPSPEDTEV